MSPANPRMNAPAALSPAHRCRHVGPAENGRRESRARRSVAARAEAPGAPLGLGQALGGHELHPRQGHRDH
eukprot:scaffold309052_cov14-Prasinocladus_malaysianus.AAC.1